jgi:DNA-binding HxlR family transcriptional regulator
MASMASAVCSQSAACPTRQVVGRIGDKWTLLVLYALGEGTLRLSRLRSEVEGISQKMLTQTLRALERDGIILRHVYATIPPKVEYSLTPLGESLGKAMATVRTGPTLTWTRSSGPDRSMTSATRWLTSPRSGGANVASRRRALDGQANPSLARDVRFQAERALALLEKGLGRCPQTDQRPRRGRRGR